MRRLILLFVLFIPIISFAQEEKPLLQKYEYWFDMDYGNKVTEDIPEPDSIFLLDASLNTRGLLDGLHYLNIRFQDDSLQWSSVLSTFFHKIPSEGENPKFSLVAYEYWVDTNYLEKVHETLDPEQEVIILDSLLDLDELDYGLHILNIRFEDNAGQWSSVLSHFFNYLGSSNESKSLISAYRYFFDQNYEDSVRVVLPTPTTPFLLNGKISSDLSPGMHTFNIQFQDVVGQWSSICTDTFLILDCLYPSLPTIPIGDSTLCQGISESIYTIDTVETAISYEWELMPPEAGTVIAQDTSALIQWDSLFVGLASLQVNAVNDCGAGDASILNISIARNTFTEMEEILCEGTPDTMILVLNAANGCDSIVQILQVLSPPIELLDTILLQDNGSESGSIDITPNSENYTYSWSNGATTQDISDLRAGTYTVQITNSDGCSSIFEFVIKLETSVLDIPEIGLSIQVSPVPVKINAELSIFTESSSQQVIQLDILDNLGRLVLKKDLEINPGKGRFFIDSPNAVGSYFINITTNSGKTAIAKIVIIE